MEEVKIIYCYDENKNPIHHSKTVRGEKYFCIDCGSELICKEGNIKVKHLAHKNTENCGGSGESIFHKHWKENFFKAGMYINVANRISKPDNVEILDVLNEVSLRERYNKDWDIDIIVDTLLITEKGEIVVEIHYTNPKDWDKLKPYYDELDLLRVYELTVGKTINAPVEWFCLGEEEEIALLSEYYKIKAEEKRLEQERIKKEKAILKQLEKERQKREHEQQLKEIAQKLIDEGKRKKIKIFFNFKNKLEKVAHGVYELTCLYEKNTISYEKINLRFDVKKLKCTESKLLKTFEITNGINGCFIVVDFDLFDPNQQCEVVSSWNPFKVDYNARLYANLCNIK